VISVVIAILNEIPVRALSGMFDQWMERWPRCNTNGGKYRLNHKYMRQPRPRGSGVSLSDPYISRVCTPRNLIWIKLDLTVWIFKK
jgi:hypothetical protein